MKKDGRGGQGKKGSRDPCLNWRGGKGGASSWGNMGAGGGCNTLPIVMKQKAGRNTSQQRTMTKLQRGKKAGGGLQGGLGKTGKIKTKKRIAVEKPQACEKRT